MRVVIVILALHLCMGLASALSLAKKFQTILRISSRTPIAKEVIEAEMEDWLNWLQFNYPDINGYQNIQVTKTRRGMDIQFELMYEDTIENLSTFFSKAYAAYKNFTIFTTYPNFRELEFVSLFGDPHLAFMFGQIKLCIDTKEGLNDILSLYHRPDSDVMINVDFYADKKEHRKKHGKMKWIKDVAYLSPEINIIINKRKIEVHNNMGAGGRKTKLRWANDESFEIGNTYVNIDERKMVIYRFPDDESMSPDTQCEIYNPGAGLNIHILNDDMGADAGFFATLRSHIADVVTGEDEGTLTTDFGQDIPLENYKDKCWKIPNGGIDVFPNDDFKDFFMACLDCEEPKSLRAENP